MHYSWPPHHSSAQTLLDVLHYAAPIILLFFFLFAFALRSILTAQDGSPSSDASKPDSKSTTLGPGGRPLPKKRTTPPDTALIASLDFSRPRKLLFTWLSAAIPITLVANAANVLLHALVARHDGWWCGKAVVVYIVGCFFVYCLYLISLIDTRPSPTTVHLSSWALAIIIEALLLGSSLALYSRVHPDSDVHALKAAGPVANSSTNLRDHMTQWEVAEVLIDFLRLFILLALASFYLIFVVSRNAKIREAKHAAAHAEPSERTSLLSGSHEANGSANLHPPGYGAANAGEGQKQPAGTPAGWEKPDKPPSFSWWQYLKGYGTIFPYLWPAKDRRLQIVVVICFVIVALQRGLNILVPYQTGVIIDLLSEDYPQMPWTAICLFIVYRFLQGGNGILGAARSTLWIPVSQYSYREISVRSFEHVHSLSLEFHLGKKTGEVLSALGKGSSINTFLEQISFSVVPMLIDLCVAIAYFLIAFDAYYALVIAIVTFGYIYLTIRMAQWRADIRRQMVNADREEEAVKNDSMISYETVKYFNAEAWEFSRYKEAVNKFLTFDYKTSASLQLMNVCQNMVFMIGLLCVCFIAAYQISNGQRKVGDFVTLTTYMAQLQSPLNFFGTFYRMIQSALINSERMLELLKEEPTVTDSTHAQPLPSSDGSIDFKDVHFSYDDRKPALHGLDFRCEPGTTTALVGESGGGKSTVFRLFFRFYNPQSGSINVAGHDVQDVTIDSLRKQIGVVPQDTVLFNETLMYNLRYANRDASDETIYKACQAACIHDKILTFPDGYNTKVGERGLRLSGGEKQRVAIARTILKDPRYILLDEATASLDTETEQHIQDALNMLATGRTTLIIAHRLSTITLADQILVLHDGRVDERGTHEELLALKGRYSNMWRKQVRAQKAAEEARKLQDRAEKLRQEAADRESSSANQSDDERELSMGSGGGVTAGPRGPDGVRRHNRAAVRSSSSLALDLDGHGPESGVSSGGASGNDPPDSSPGDLPSHHPSHSDHQHQPGHHSGPSDGHGHPSGHGHG